jgi:hypothetical protein
MHGVSLVAGVAANHFLLAMQKLGSWGEIVNIGGRGYN